LGVKETGSLSVRLARAMRTGKLDLSEMELTTLPLEVFQLTNLTNLSLSGNRLTALPPEIAQLTNLQSLSLNENQLTAVPSEVIQLINLQSLYMLGNQLTALPPEITQLTNLQSLDLNVNRLTVVPPEVVQLTSLRKLHMRGNQLTALPPEIGQLTKLNWLNLRENQLTALPPEIGQLTSLEDLILGNNRLTALPPEIGQFAKLDWLELYYNQLTALPPEIGQLTSLKRLVLSDNWLTALPPEIGQLANLDELDLSRNQLTELPPEMTRLANLRYLLLSRNQLTELPSEIAEFANLQSLDVGDNQLTVLPRQLADFLLKGLKIEVSGNPLGEPFPELLERGTSALVTYLRSLGDAIPQYEAKVLLVGEGNVGKTSLIAALRGEPFVENRPTTHGIEIQSLTIRHPDIDVDIIVRLWDFGGQEVYRIIHQFFFSRRALYLIVWNAREGQEQDEVEGWVRRIRLRVSGDARALIVATHCDERHPDLDYTYLERSFSEVLARRYEIDNLSGSGISELREGVAVQAAGLPQMGQLISPRWIATRDEILAQAATQPQISYEQFADTCRGHGVDGDEIVTLAELMHDLGLIIYYGDDEGLRDFVILDPEWLTKAISRVLEDKPTRTSGGVLDHARLGQVWPDVPVGLNEPAYPRRYHPYFLRLMEKFDISYRLEDDEGRSLVAQLVPYDRPELPWDTRMPPPGGIRRLALVCQLGEPVPGLVAWLTVRHHRASTGRHWRAGVFLRHPIAAYASEALLELRTPDQLVIDVRAPSPDLFFNVLRDSVEDLITRRWPGLTYQLLIPCPTRSADGLSCRGQFSLKFLLGYREKGGTRVPCQECFVDRDISELLTGFAQPDLPLQLELEQIRDQVVDIGSDVKRVEGGVSRLEAHAAEAADSMRRILQVIGSEITDCPRLFTLTGEVPSGSRRLKFYQRHYRLTLWCEHAGHWHPWPAASYSLDEPRDWLARIGPYAILVFKALQVVVPIAGAVAEVVLTPDQLKHAQHELKLMTTLVAALPTEKFEDQREFIAGESSSQFSPAQGQAARALRILLFDHDHLRAFGDLRRVQTPSGDLAWVCADHYPEYDPGLPNIPQSQPRDALSKAFLLSRSPQPRPRARLL
jgi:internalin A